MSNDIADANPKDKVGATKVPLGLLPAAGVIYGALAADFGAYRAGPEGIGYGPYNWRERKIRYTRYLDALDRHIKALRDREDTASDSGVHHLGHLIACAAIMCDAIELGLMVDDRPPRGPAADLLARHVKRAV